MYKPRSRAPSAVMAVILFVLTVGAVSCEDSEAPEGGGGGSGGAAGQAGGGTAGQAGGGAVGQAGERAGKALALTPPMGFNDWNAFGCAVSETLIKQTADFFVSSGLKDLGYEYVNIDDCWSLMERDTNGRLAPDPVKFPSGIKGLADYVHSQGLKLGIYGDAGTKTCAGYPGSLGNEELDAASWAEWGVDYLKYDNCYNQSDGSRADYVRRYTAMRDALAKTGRDILYSICEWGQSQPWQWAVGVGQLWRTGSDIADNWSSLRSIIAFNATLAPYAGPGHWNDPDMLEIGNGGMTATEYRTHMGMWAMMAAPLIIGTDLRKASAETLSILSNQEIIAIDQDPLGKQATLVTSNAGLMVLRKPLASGEHAIALYNATDSLAVISVPANETGLAAASAYRLHDVWTGSTVQTETVIAAGVPAHGTLVYLASESSAPDTLPPLVSVGGTVATLISGLAEGTNLTTTVTNRGVGDAADARISVAAPTGWNVTAEGAGTAEALSTNESLETTWNVQVPEGIQAGRYAISVTVTYTWGEPDSNGERGQASSTAEVTAVVVAAPQEGTTPLSKLSAVSSKNARGDIEVDMSNGAESQGDGNLITIGGEVYTRGLGTYAPSEIVYYLGGKCSTLTTDVGLDEAATTGAAAFTIYADGTAVAESGSMTADDAAQTLTADVTGAQWLRLVTEAGDASGSNYADWAAPLLVCGSSTAPTIPEVTLFSFESGTEQWTFANASPGGSVSASTLFHTDGENGLEVVSPADGNWFGRALSAPLDLSAYSTFMYEVKTGPNGTSGEIAIQVGAANSWCQGGLWTWTNANSSRTIKEAVSGIQCPPGVTLDLTRVTGIWVFLKGGTFQIDNVRAE
jgi:alpha-galactosidase